MIAWWGPVIHECYGASELGYMTLLTPEQALRNSLQLAQRADPATASRLVAGMARQLRHHLEDQQRWQALADNAAYYRDNRQAAERIAARLLQE